MSIYGFYIFIYLWIFIPICILLDFYLGLLNISVAEGRGKEPVILNEVYLANTQEGDVKHCWEDCKS